MTTKRLSLTDGEWMRLIDGERDDSALPKCCANISALRDDLIGAARNGGRVDFVSSVTRTFEWCFPDHDVPDPLIEKIADQLGVDLKKPDHDAQPVEL